MALLADIAGWLLLGAGSAFAIIAGIGVLRLPDVYTRMHAAGIGDTLAAWLILFGLMAQSSDPLVTIKLVLIYVFLVFTSPTASHALARAAMVDGIEPWRADKER